MQGNWKLYFSIPAVTFLILMLTEGQQRRVSFPPPPPPSATPTPTARDFVGAQACAPCHREQFDAWLASTHGRAGGSPSPTLIIAPFDGVPIRFKDALVTPTRSEKGEYLFVVEQQGEGHRIFRVDGVVGGGHMVGGGTQAYFSRFPDGTLRLLPFEYSKQADAWFTNTNPRSKKGWISITPDLALAECGDWPPVRVLGSDARFGNCQECHGSQIQLTFDAQTKMYQTRFESLAINCESCHGPARRHVELARAGKLATAEDIGLPSLNLLDKDGSLQVCFQCHALKDVVRPGYLPGKPFEEYYALKFPFLGERPYLPDGRIRTFAYQEGHLFSDCYLNGSMTCVSCHDPHSQQYRDVNRNPLPDRFDDRQCTGCHASKAMDAERHTHHPSDSPGSRCVACHMPYLQHPEVKQNIPFARSDHTIAIPRPRFDASWDLESACQKCHRHIPVLELERNVREWYGETKPHKPSVEGLVRAQTVSNRVEAAVLLLQPSTSFPISQFMGMSTFLERFLSPDMAELEQPVIDSLKQLAGHADLDVQSLALAMLHLARGDEPEVRSYLLSALKGLGKKEYAVRRRWMMALGHVGDSRRGRGEYGEAVAAYRKALEIFPGNADVLFSLAQAYAEAGAWDQAIETYRQSLRADSTQSLVYVNLGIAYAAKGDWRKGVEMLEKAIAQNPYEPLAYFNLGNVYLEQQNPARAIPLYSRAVELDPSLALGHYHLARAYLLSRDFKRALAAVRKSLEFDPTRESARQMRRDLERVVR